MANNNSRKTVSQLTVDEYIVALKKINLSDTEKNLLNAMYRRTISARELSLNMGYADDMTSNLHLGRLGHRLAEVLPDVVSDYIRSDGSPVWYNFVCYGEWVDKIYFWTLHPSLVKAIEQLEIIKEAEILFLPYEVTPNEIYIEGALRMLHVNAHERNAEARRKCIEHYGVTCQVCDFDFQEVYGAIGEGYIEVHHVKPLSEINESYSVNPIQDLIPVCPNCHAMLHQRKPPYAIYELREILNRG